MTQPLAQGELLFVSTPGAERLYIGNGSTLGGIQITGYTDANAKDATAASFAGGTHNNITFSYNAITKSISANVDLSNYQGIIKASAFTGSVFADDGSTLNSQPLVDAISGTFNGNLVGNVTGNVTGNITGDIFTNLIDSANSSAITFTPSVIFNSDVTVENELFATLTGNVIGNIQGNVTNTVGTNIVDIGNATFNGAGINLIDGSVITSSGTLFVDTAFTNFLSTTPIQNFPYINIYSTNNTGSFTGGLGLARSRGNAFAPTTVLNGDEVGSLLNVAHDGTTFTLSASINTIVDGAVSTGVVPGRIEISTANSTGVIAVRATVKSSTVEFAVPPKLPVVADDTARTALVPTPSTGMMIFMQAGSSPAATNKVQVYDSTAWVNLH
jgi:hypothetical protein